MAVHTAEQDARLVPSSEETQHVRLEQAQSSIADGNLGDRGMSVEWLYLI